MSRARFSPRAVRDLEEISSFIATDNPGAAARVRRVILNTADLLARHRELGRRLRKASVRHRWERTPSIGLTDGCGLGQPAEVTATAPAVSAPYTPLTVANHEGSALRRQTTAGVPQTSQSAVSRVSQPADRPLTGRARLLNGLPIGKSAIPQVGKPAVRTPKNFNDPDQAPTGKITCKAEEKKLCREA